MTACKNINGRAKHLILPALFLFPILVLSGCDLPDFLRPSAKMVREQTNSTAEPNTTKMMSPREKFAFHKWLVLEMQEQIFARPAKDQNSAAGWANVLGQRASIEGVYHGIILSSEYANLEKGNAADIKALRFYGNEMAMLEFPSAQESDARVQGAAAKYVKESMGLPIYTLKRELGERILREADKRRGDTEKLAAWFAGIASRWARQDINFGMPQRNNKDEAFHFNWAKENTLGMIQWELLNKAHRILNHLGGIAVSPTGK
jgi:hypothetical protein